MKKLILGVLVAAGTWGAIGAWQDKKESDAHAASVNAVFEQLDARDKAEDEAISKWNAEHPPIDCFYVKASGHGHDRTWLSKEKPIFVRENDWIGFDDMLNGGAVFIPTAFIVEVDDYKYQEPFVKPLKY